MVTHKFSTNAAKEGYVSRMIQQMNTDMGKTLNDEQALRVLIDLTDELRRSDNYSPEFKQLIFDEVDKRVAAK